MHSRRVRVHLDWRAFPPPAACLERISVFRKPDELMNTQTIVSLIQEAMPDARVDVRSDDNVHFAAQVVSPAFEGLSRIRRHQLVYGALGERMGGEIHALSLRTLTPEELAGQGA
mgnify:CR=1 FL=1|jgi:acid stress-induced BolA-like protein IbaG/YrbA